MIKVVLIQWVQRRYMIDYNLKTRYKEDLCNNKLWQYLDQLMERQLRAGGGIMTLEEPRQGYFLGKIVKKAKRVVKKVAKSL